MAHLPEESKFDDGVYQLEMTDPVVGGPNGISNSPLRNLANRTRWLKDQLTAILTSKADRQSPQLTGEPTTTEPGENDNSTRIASTGWVRSLVARLAAPLSHVGSRGDAHAEATTSEAGFMSAADKTKLNGIATGAQANTVTSVAGRTGAVTLAVGDVSGALASSHAGTGGNAHALATTSQAGFMSAADKAKLNGIAAGAGAGAVTSVAGRTGAVTLSAADVSGVVPSSGGTFSGRIYAGLADYDPPNDNSVMTYHWLKKYGVLSVAGKKGAVTLNVADVAGAAPAASPTFSGRISVAAGTITDLNHEQGAKVYVPARKVSDMTAPEAVSKYALQDYAAPKSSPSLTGSPTAPTPGNAENSTRLATTAWVRNAMRDIADKTGFTFSWGGGLGDFNGYIKFPSWLGGIIIQSKRVDSGGYHSYPIAFPRSVMTVVGCTRVGAAYRFGVSHHSLSQVRAEFLEHGSNGVAAMVLAIGY